MRDGGSGGTGGSGNNSSACGSGRRREDGGRNLANRYEWSSLASPWIDSSLSTFMEVAEGTSGVPDGGSGGSCGVGGNTDRSESGSGGDPGSRDNIYDWSGDNPYNRPPMHPHHKPETVEASHTAMYPPGAVVLNTPRRAFAWPQSMPSIKEAQEKEGKVVEERRGGQGEEQFISSMLLESQEVQGDMLLPEGWLPHLLTTEEDGDDPTDEMMYRFLAEDHFGMQYS